MFKNHLKDVFNTCMLLIILLMQMWVFLKVYSRSFCDHLRGKKTEAQQLIVIKEKIKKDDMFGF